MSSDNTEGVLIVSITPYFLERGNFWFDENLKKILEARKTQSFFEDNTAYVQKNQNLNLSEFLRKLDEMGYEKVLEISFPGEFSQRGGIVDVFPVNSNCAFRFDFLGNKIENIEILPVSIDDERSAREILRKRLKSQKIYSDLKNLKLGDFLVHIDHGIGIFRGLSDISDAKYYELEYAEGDRLFVPEGLERKLSRYVGFLTPKISRLGSMTWGNVKKRAKEDAEKFAKELLEIYAKREIEKRTPYVFDSEIEKIISNSFDYLETPDQLQAINDIKKDLEEKDEPMDRIVCGDVGFGKTEVALRAMTEAVVSGRQSILLCPTTILARQHFFNFKERLKNLPIRIALLSRFEKEQEQKKITENLKEGEADIVIGTHRLLSEDVAFKNLGLLVIDDEQRFGVRQKEKFKKMRASLDVLSLSATPIPRTLYMALSSLKSISLIQTPPIGRLPVKTHVFPFKKEIIKKAIEEEMKRHGQIYYLHNRVENIHAIKNFLNDLVPEANIGIAHGRMNEKELLRTMDDFQNKKIDVLVATTIIENGIDLPNANTLIVDDATRLGLAQAHQIRGRIGRSDIQAFAYFLHPKKLKGLAQERLKALKEAKELGSGYRVAMKDLEIRGAGNILGREQSGTINKVGLNLYCQILAESIEKLKSQAQ
jgi:transcription-repair coupling factor (superfamily II helicase)